MHVPLSHRCCRGSLADKRSLGSAFITFPRKLISSLLNSTAKGIQIRTSATIILNHLTDGLELRHCIWVRYLRVIFWQGPKVPILAYEYFGEICVVGFIHIRRAKC